MNFNIPLNYKLFINRRSSKRLQWKPQKCSAGQPADVGRSQGGEAEPLTVSTSAGKECFTVGSLHRPMCFVSVYKAVVKASNLEVCFNSNVIFKLFSNISRAGYSLEECLQLRRKVNSCSISRLWRYCSPCNILKCCTTSPLSGVATFELGSWLLTIYHHSFGVLEVKSRILISEKIPI